MRGGASTGAGNPRPTAIPTSNSFDPMTSCNLDSDCPPLFVGTNYFWWQEIMELYVKHKDLDLWKIIMNGPMIIEKSKDRFTNDDYKLMSKNSKAMHIL